jgi:hypothetical protein
VQSQAEGRVTCASARPHPHCSHNMNLCAYASLSRSRSQKFYYHHFMDKKKANEKTYARSPRNISGPSSALMCLYPHKTILPIYKFTIQILTNLLKRCYLRIADNIHARLSQSQPYRHAPRNTRSGSQQKCYQSRIMTRDFQCT